MIQSLEIHNYQSHKHSKLEFADGVNVIVGGSDTGKTSIIRALRWLIWNRPTGDAFRSTWGGSTSVDIIMDNQNIVRVKDQTGSEYALGKNIFKAFGTEVPQEILKVLNVNEINLQQQLDRPFLLDSSPGEVAQHFNRVAHLDQIDEGLRRVQQWIRAIEQDITSNERQAKQLEEELQNFAHLEVFEEDVEVLESMQSQLITKVNSKTKLTNLIADVHNIVIYIEQESEILKAEKTLNNVLDWIGNRNAKQQQRNQLADLIEETKELVDNSREQRIIITAEVPVTRLLNLFKDKKSLEITLLELQELIDSMNNNIVDKQEAEVQVERFTEEFNDLFPDICPLCGQKVKKL